jgi:hypothetical protein
MRIERVVFSSDVPEHAAKEMIAVGIVPSLHPRPKGYQFWIGSQPVVVTGHATKAEFLEAVQAAGITGRFETLPENFHFLRISTD